MWRIAKTKLLIIPAIAGLSAFGMAQSQTPRAPTQCTAVRKSAVAGYAGTWVGNLEGRPWLTVTLTQQGEQLAGSLQRPATMQFTDQGDVKSIGDEQLAEPVTEAVVNPDGLLLSVKNEQTQQTEHFTMRLTGENTAELKMSAMSMPPGMPKLKPWKLSKTAMGAAASR
jgi:hypothetical protein